MHGQKTSKFILLIFSVPGGTCNFFFRDSGTCRQNVGTWIKGRGYNEIQTAMINKTVPRF